jgi:hypothetical protein
LPELWVIVLGAYHYCVGNLRPEETDRSWGK